MYLDVCKQYKLFSHVYIARLFTKTSGSMSMLLKKLLKALSCVWLLLASKQVHYPLPHVICRLDASISQSTSAFLLMQGGVFVQTESTEHYVKILSKSSCKLLLSIWQVLGALLLKRLQNKDTAIMYK